MVSKEPVWVFVADIGKGRLLRCEVAPLNRCHVEEEDRIESARPARRKRKPAPHAGRTGNGLENREREEDEELHRFARLTGAWLAARLKRHHMGRLVIFAPPRFLGALRKTRWINGAAPIEKRRADLAHLNSAAIAKHPAIHALMGLSR